MADARERYLWVGKDAGLELARRILRAGDRFVRAEARPHPAHPEDGLVWRVVERGPDDAPTVMAEENALNDTWWCPPICPGGGGGG